MGWGESSPVTKVLQREIPELERREKFRSIIHAKNQMHRKKYYEIFLLVCTKNSGTDFYVELKYETVAGKGIVVQRFNFFFKFAGHKYAFGNGESQ